MRSPLVRQNAAPASSAVMLCSRLAREPASSLCCTCRSPVAGCRCALAMLDQVLDINTKGQQPA
ncbi:hypothetical protein FA09DRAFT_95893 [Tilletiopsis washingtonensis]|uniref:Uncharacterized protein n=1 Tax=Tilletiopsis washingtonensis TaxID=58919 RepID=A0A316Z7S7_9BASI|nr:hypothetical protein FA09DRAFT_95893 [Tilletiopsis washingtonensis]PWN96223.1 hypothetical protein FA09DRAFT_95893 [Tilletiopsis washingtonensis]